jgi:hypothetical protein
MRAGATKPGPHIPAKDEATMNTIEMKTINVIYASGALKKFLDARAQGASRELLMQLSADSLAELDVERSKVPARRTNLADVVIDFNRARRKQKAI